MGICNSKRNTNIEIKQTKRDISEEDLRLIDLISDDSDSEIDENEMEFKTNENVFNCLENEMESHREQMTEKRVQSALEYNSNIDTTKLENFVSSVKNENEAITILYLEDEEFHFRLIEYLLKKKLNAKFELLWANDGVIGYNMIKKYDPDIILLDINLPNMKGDVILTKLKSENYDMSKIAVISKLTKNSDFVKVINVGVLDYLTKPIDIINFITTMENRVNKTSP